MDLDAILRRVQKLLAIANDSRGDANEAVAAAAQAENILRKFNLDHADVLAAQLRAARPEDVMGTTRVRANMKRDTEGRPPLKRAPKWAGWLAIAVASLYDSQVRYVWDSKMGGTVVEFCGVRADAQVAGWTFDYLVGQMILGVRTFTAQHRQRYGAPPDKVQNSSFRDAFVMALVVALRALRKMKQAELLGHVSGTSLVVCKAQAVAAHFGAAEYGETKESTKMTNEAAAAAGYAAGRRVDVARRAVGAVDAKLKIE